MAADRLPGLRGNIVTEPTIPELADQVRAGLEADGLWATEASRERGHLIEGGAHWRWVHGEDWEPVTPDPSRGYDLTTNDGEYFCGKLISVEEFPRERGESSPMYASGRVSVQDIPAAAAGHLARHDPARVLAEVAAKRALLDLALGWKHHVCDDQYYTCLAATQEHDGGVYGEGDKSGPCTCGRDEKVRAVLTLLAQSYLEEQRRDEIA
jgi:hypothetical protein